VACRMWPAGRDGAHEYPFCGDSTPYANRFGCAPLTGRAILSPARFTPPDLPEVLDAKYTRTSARRVRNSGRPHGAPGTHTTIRPCDAVFGDRCVNCGAISEPSAENDATIEEVMAKKEGVIEMEGAVVEALPNAMF